ncbi:beta,beta-carotene 15,15'-dioxygenase-like [Scylla paramamosain]|uniref:beta,beta-carotene 15,15'-dioxygenase-like n=1 Tax=Scylla paramamosain TaxID=85552 RepID=UPI00308271C3
MFHYLVTTFFKLPVPANVMSDNCLVNVCQAKDQMFALTETCFLRRVDPESLDTFEKKEDISNYVAVNMATAHPHIEPDGTVYNLGSSFSLINGPELRIVRFPEGKLEGASVVGTASSRWRAALPYVHSFAMTENYWVVGEQPLVLSLGKMLRQYVTLSKMINALTWLPDENLRFIVIDRKTGKPLPTTYTAPPIILFHHINAWEEDGHLVVDFLGTMNGMHYTNFFFSNFRKSDTDPSKVIPDSRPCRLVLPLKVTAEEAMEKQHFTLKDTLYTAVRKENGELHCTPALLSPVVFELPRINYLRNGLPYRYTYGVTGGSEVFFQRLVKLDVETGKTWYFQEEGYVAAEPIFVPRPGATKEDDGIILSSLLKLNDSRYVALVVLNAKDMSQLARVRFTAEGDVTYPFHGQFVDPREEVHLY